MRYVFVVNFKMNKLKRVPALCSMRINCSAFLGVPVKREMLCLKCFMMFDMRSSLSSVGFRRPSVDVHDETARKDVRSNSSNSSASIATPRLARLRSMTARFGTRSWIMDAQALYKLWSQMDVAKGVSSTVLVSPPTELMYSAVFCLTVRTRSS